MNAPSRLHTIRFPRPFSRPIGPLGLCLLLALVSATTVAAAREIKLAADSPSCQEAHHEPPASSPVPPPAAAGAGKARVKHSLHSDTIRGGNLQSPRWHSFLPGMFR